MEHFKHFEHMVWMMNKMKCYIHLYENQHVPTFNDDLARFVTMMVPYA